MSISKKMTDVLTIYINIFTDRVWNGVGVNILYAQTLPPS